MKLSTLPSIISTPQTASTTTIDQDELQRKMDEINRQIEAQKMAIAGILTKTDLVSF